MAFDALPAGLAPQDVPRLIQEALDHGLGLLTLEDVRKGLEDGTYRLWVGRSSVCVTQINEYPGGSKALVLFVAAGDPKEFPDYLPGIEAYGRGAGCRFVLYWGRASKAAGWQKLTPGYRTTHTLQVKEL